VKRLQEETIMKPYFVVTIVATLVIVGALGTPFGSSATAQGASAQGSAPSQQSPNMQDMMKMHEQMMAQMKAADAKLDALVKQMDASRGDAKVTAIAAVVSELVLQNKSMHEHMGQMHQQMMSGRGMMMNR